MIVLKFLPFCAFLISTQFKPLEHNFQDTVSWCVHCRMPVGMQNLLRMYVQPFGRQCHSSCSDSTEMGGGCPSREGGGCPSTPRCVAGSYMRWPSPLCSHSGVRWSGLLTQEWVSLSRVEGKSDVFLPADMFVGEG